jgi:methionyl-tRNA formyltransferase
MTEKSLRLLLVGSRTYSRRVLVHLHEEGWPVVGAVGRLPGENTDRTGADSFRDVCERGDVTLVLPEDINDPDVVETLSELEPDLGVCCGWTQIIAPEVLDVPTHGFVGVHASPLPEGRGGAPVNWQLIRDRDAVGVSLFEFTPEVDHGDIIEQRSVPVERRDDISTVYDKVTAATFDLLDDGLAAFADGVADGTPQRFADATYLPNRAPQDGLIDWSLSTVDQWNWIRALTHPYPGAFTFYEEDRLTVWEAKPTDRDGGDAENGEVIAVEPGRGLLVATGDGVVCLRRVQRDERPELWGDDFAARHNIGSEAVLGQPSDFPDWLYTGIRGPEDGFDFETNAETGETVTVRAVALAHARERKVTIEAALDGDELIKTSVTVDGWTSRAVPVRLDTAGPHTFRVSFAVDGETVDVRRLKLYAT